ncbi:MAG: malto-oligosyltrehalose synthase [Candidatus Latescibacterota bacterium]
MHSMNSSYRLQFTPSFGFRDAVEVVPYLSELGIGSVYASPVFRAAKGSTHGYNVIDQNAINPEYGGEDGFESLSGTVREHGLGWIQDIVPNHMAFNSENSMLMEVLESGENSEYYFFFDIDWDSPREGLKGRLLTPFLGKFYGESLEEREIQLKYDQDGFTANYFDYSFPLKLESYTGIISYGLNRLRKKLGRTSPEFLKLLGTLYVLQNLPSGESLAERKDQVQFVKQMLWELYTASEDIREYIDENITAFNGEKGKPESFNKLDRLLSAQHFRLAYWKVATWEINYKRFFTINELIALRSESERVFEVTHAYILRLVREGKFTGLRVDHIDGLFDPGGYLHKLREKAGEVSLFVEKILDLDEELPRNWPVQGTTGYDFLNHVNEVFCDSRNEPAMDRIYARFTGITESYRHLEYEKKKLIIESHMIGDIDNLASFMKKVSSSYRHSYDITLNNLEQAIIEVMARYPVYRTYIGYDDARPAEDGYARQAVKAAAEDNPELAYELDFIERFLLLQYDDTVTRENQELWKQVVQRFEQFTVPLMAKGVEDTVLYNYNRLLSLNEVGGNPYRFGISPEVFHAYNQRMAEHWPGCMNATSTHDTKRGEDVRARLNVLSEIPHEWEERAGAWKDMNAGLKKRVGGRDIPDGNEEYFLYQTLVGAFPFEEGEYPSFRDRMREYIRKSSREEKVYTQWIEPDTAYENAFIAFMDSLLDPSENNAFLKDFLPFQRRVAWYGMLNSLSQVLLKITAPGFPDFYQGTELWDLTLVDPDNRRPVDYGKRRSLLQGIASRSNDIPALIPELFGSKEDGRVKLFLIHQALKARNTNAELFTGGAYIPLESAGKQRQHCIAFARQREGNWSIALVPRLVTDLGEEEQLPLGNDVWGDTRITLPAGVPGAWENALTGERLDASGFISVGDALKSFPVAMLISVR